MTTINFNNFSKISTTKREKLPEEQLKKNRYNYIYQKKTGYIRLYNDFSTTIDEIENKINYKFSLYLDEKNNILYFKREKDGITIKNTTKTTSQENYFQFPKKFTENLKKEDLNIKIKKLDNNTFSLDYKTIKK